MSATAELLNAVAFYSKEEVARLVAAHKGLRLRPRNPGTSELKEPPTVFFSEPFGNFLVSPKTIIRMWKYCPLEVGDRGYSSYRTSLDARLDISESGVFVSENAGGMWTCSKCHQPLRHKFLRALSDENPGSGLLRELVDNDFHIFIPWADILEGGMESIPALFNRFAKGNPTLLALAKSGLSPFNISPNEHIFVPEKDKEEIVRGWKEDLNKFMFNLKK